MHMSHNPKSCFWSWFHMPLFKVSKIVGHFITKGWIGLMHHCWTNEHLQLKVELLVLGSLAMLGGTIQLFHQLKPLTHRCASYHSNFFLHFVERITSISQEYVFMPHMPEELEPIMRRYEEEGLPSIAGLVNVVHVKRLNCPAGDYNLSKGKDLYPSLAFKCITDFDCRILGVFGPQFRSNNGNHIFIQD